MIKVAIADDHPIMREGIKKVLENEIDIEIIGEVSDGGELQSMLYNRLPDLLIMDITMPGKSGLDLIKDISNLYPQLPALVLSIHPPKRFAVRALKAGAYGYLCKTSISKELVNAIRKIATQNRKYITPETAELLAQQVHGNGNENVHSSALLHETLSDREFEVLCMIAAGNEIKEIADNLTLSPHTIRTYRSRIKDKMNLATNVEMTRYAMENELVN